MREPVVFLCLLPLISGFAQSTSLELYVWNRYTADFDSLNLKGSEFALKRAYLRINHSFSDRVSARFNLDFFSSERYPDGAGVKVKYAYVQFKDLLIPHSRFTWGLVKTYFGTVYEWDYTCMEKAPEDLYHAVSSTDYGLSLSGSFPGEYGEYAVFLLNGEGYRKTGRDVDLSPASGVHLRITPIYGITLGGSLIYEPPVDTLPYELYAAGVVKIRKDPVSITGEYLYTEENGEAKQGFMAMFFFNLKKLVKKDLQFVLRWDRWNEENLLFSGLNWYILRREKGKPGIVLQTAWERKPEKMKDRFMFQIRWEFATKI